MDPDPRELTVVAVFQARPGQDAALGEALTAMLAPTRAEDGCIRYDLHRTRGVAGQWFFDEIWATAAHHAAHRETAHVQALLARGGELYEAPIAEYKGDRVEPAWPGSERGTLPAAAPAISSTGGPGSAA